MITLTLPLPLLNPLTFTLNKLINNKKYFLFCFMLSVLPWLMKSAAAGGHEAELREQALSMFKPLRLDKDASKAASSAEIISLGRALFFDKRISSGGTISCGQCHLPDHYGAGVPPVSSSDENNLHLRNVQSVLNASLNFANNWYGDTTSVEDQALASLVSPSGLALASSDAAMAKIQAIPEYTTAFSRAFPDNSKPVTPENWAVAIGAYERTLLTPSPFDAYLAGDDKAISAAAKTGLRRFIDTGCVACHNGIGIGGGSNHKFGIWEDYWPVTKSTQIDKGRFNVTKDDNDLYVFRVANLRNVRMTAPYFHDGSVKNLSDAVRIMGKIQLRKTLSNEDVKYIVAFLDTLTGKVPETFSLP